MAYIHSSFIKLWNILSQLLCIKYELNLARRRINLTIDKIWSFVVIFPSILKFRDRETYVQLLSASLKIHVVNPLVGIPSGNNAVVIFLTLCKFLSAQNATDNVLKPWICSIYCVRYVRQPYFRYSPSKYFKLTLGFSIFRSFLIIGKIGYSEHSSLESPDS